MNRLIVLIITATVLAPVVSAGINLPSPREFILDNGVTVWVIERHALPLFSVGIVFKAGSIYDPDGKEGLANLCNDLLLRGTADRSAKDISDQVSFGGGQLFNYCDRGDAGLFGEFMPQYGETCFEIVGDILLNSSFSEDEIETSKNKIVGQLAGRFDQPGTLADEYMFKHLLGGSPYAHNPMGSRADLETISREDIVGFSSGYYTPDRCLVIVCGDVNGDTVHAWVEKYLGSWRNVSGVKPVASDFKPGGEPGILVIDKKEATQTQIRIGGIGFPKDHSDRIPFEAARTIFAGSFMSRLVDEIRVNRGLAYSVDLRSSNFSPGGIAYVATATRNETVGEVIEVIVEESRRMQTDPVSDSELTAAINYRSGLYPLDFETSDNLLSAFIQMWLYDLPSAYFEDFPEALRRTTPDEIMAQAGKYFPTAESPIVLVGPAELIVPQVGAYGRIKVVEIGEL